MWQDLIDVHVLIRLTYPDTCAITNSIITVVTLSDDRTVPN